jgi:hypothetical protein
MASQERTGLPQKWGSGGNRCLRERVVSGGESLSEAGAEPAVVDSAAKLEQETGASAAIGSFDGLPGNWLSLP